MNFNIVFILAIFAIGFNLTAQNDFYHVKEEAHIVDNLLNYEDFRISTQFNLNPNFPIDGDYIVRSPKTGTIYSNIDKSDAAFEIITVMGSYLHIFKTDGSEVTGWPFQFPSNLESEWAPSLGDIDGDGEDDIVVSATYQASGSIYAFDLDGSIKPGFPINNMGPVPMLPVLGDMEGDGIYEIIVGERAGVGGKMNVFKGDGSIYPGWPFDMQEYPGSSVAVGDLDQDGTIDIVGESRNKIWVWDKDGNVRNGWPYDLDSTDVELTSFSAPIIVDVDKNGQYEIAFGTHDTAFGYVYLMNHDGTVKPGYPVSTSGWIFGAPMAADLNGDGIKEIIVGDISSLSAVHALDTNGLDITGFPAGPFNGVYNQITVSDIDNNGDYELLFDQNIQDSLGNGFYVALNHDGSLFGSWPLGTRGNSWFNQTVLGDINRDGMLDLVGLGDNIVTRKIYLQYWESNHTYHFGNTVNPFYQFNLRHDGFLVENTLDVENITGIDFELFPNPSNGITYLKSDSFFDHFELYDIQGQLIDYSDFSQRKETRFNIQDLANGVYFVKVNEQIQKIIKH
jgi:hypothetical protein